MSDGVPRAVSAAASFRDVIRATIRDGRLELAFRYSDSDVEVVRSIPGRKWRPDRRVWVVPHTPSSVAALTRAFGDRLVITGEPHGTGTPALDSVGSVPPAGDGMPGIAENPRQSEERILAEMRRVIRTLEYSRKTERAYVGWTRRFLEFYRGRDHSGKALSAAHVSNFLDHLAESERLSARSRNQAASALGFMLKEILGRDEKLDIPRARGPQRAPVVLSHREVMRILRELKGKYFLVAVLLYSAGLRLEECLRIRVKDVDFELRQILVRDGKGRKDRYVPLASRSAPLLRMQIQRVAELHDRDRASGHGWAPLPGALHHKDPLAGYDFGWQHVFPASTVHEDPATGRSGRWPLHATAVQREIKRAVRSSGIPKRATCHTFRHSFATETLRGGCDIRTLQHVMGHKDVRTTMIYLHVIEQSGFHVRSPLDRPDDPDEYDWDPVNNPSTMFDPRRTLARNAARHAALARPTDSAGEPPSEGGTAVPRRPTTRGDVA